MVDERDRHAANAALLQPHVAQLQAAVAERDAQLKAQAQSSEQELMSERARHAEAAAQADAELQALLVEKQQTSAELEKQLALAKDHSKDAVEAQRLHDVLVEQEGLRDALAVQQMQIEAVIKERDQQTALAARFVGAEDTNNTLRAEVEQLRAALADLAKDRRQQTAALPQDVGGSNDGTGQVMNSEDFVVEKIIEVPKVEERVVEKIVEVPEVRIVERIVEVPKVEERIVEKMVEVPEVRIVERIVEVPKVEERIVEKIVEVPEVRVVEVPKANENVRVESEAQVANLDSKLVDKVAQLNEALAQAQADVARYQDLQALSDRDTKSMRSQLQSATAEAQNARSTVKDATAKNQHLETQLARLRKEAEEGHHLPHSPTHSVSKHQEGGLGITATMAGHLHDLEVGEARCVTIADLGLGDITPLAPLDSFLQVLSALMAARADVRFGVFGVWLLCHLIYIVYLVWEHFT